MTVDKDKKKRVNNIVGSIKKVYGDKAIGTLKERYEDIKITFHKTHSYEVNAMLDGGIAKGKILELYGAESSGKTHLALEQISIEQKNDVNFHAAWVETEGSFNAEDAIKLGVDMERLALVTQDDELVADDCMEIIRGLAASGEFGMIVVNSVAGLTPKAEVESNLDKQNIALTARLMSKFLRLVAGQLSKHKCTLILVNQIRTNLNSMYATSITTGGKAVAFYASQRVEMKREKLMSGEPINENDGLKIRCKVTKNRLSKGNPFKICYYYAIYEKGIDGTLELGTVLTREGILTKKGAWLRLENEEGDVIKVPSDNGDVEAKWNGNANFVKFVKENDSARIFFEKLLEKKMAEGKVGVALTSEEIQAIRDEDLAINDQMISIDKIVEKEIEDEEKKKA